MRMKERTKRKVGVKATNQNPCGLLSHKYQYHAMKTYEGVEIKLHAFLTSALDADV
jgi:hypothetical protein